MGWLVDLSRSFDLHRGSTGSFREQTCDLIDRGSFVRLSQFYGVLRGFFELWNRMSGLNVGLNVTTHVMWGTRLNIRSVWLNREWDGSSPKGSLVPWFSSTVVSLVS